MNKIFTNSFFIVAIFSVGLSCTEIVSTENEVEKKQFEQALLNSQKIFEDYITYIECNNEIKKKKFAKELLYTLKNLDTIEYNMAPLLLNCRFSFDSTESLLDEVYFSSQAYGIAWVVKIDSFLNETNKTFKIITTNNLFKK